MEMPAYFRYTGKNESEITILDYITYESLPGGSSFVHAAFTFRPGLLVENHPCGISGMAPHIE